MNRSDERQRCLACPRCGSGLDTHRDRAWACSACASPFPWRNGWLDFSPASPLHAGLAQRLMQSKAVVSLYEDLFRPALTRLASHIGYAREQDFLQAHLGDVQGPVLDLGCGTGRYAQWLARRIGPSRVIALDLSAPMLDRAVADARRQAVSDILFLRGSALSLPLAPESLHAVTCFGALHLFEDPERAVTGIARAMRPDAPFVCMTAARMSGLLQSSSQHVLRRAATMSFFDLGDLERMLERHGFAVMASQTDRMVAMLAAKKVGRNA